MQHERTEGNMNGTIATQDKFFDFDNDTSEKIFSYSYISSTANERLQGEKKFHSTTYLLQMPRSHEKMCLKIPPQKLNFVYFV